MKPVNDISETKIARFLLVKVTCERPDISETQFVSGRSESPSHLCFFFQYGVTCPFVEVF